MAVKKQNRNGTNKKVNYRNGDMCPAATYQQNYKNWDEINYYPLPQKIYFTRFQHEIALNVHAKNKGYCWYDWEKKYIDLKTNGTVLKNKNLLSKKANRRVN